MDSDFEQNLFFQNNPYKVFEEVPKFQAAALSISEDIAESVIMECGLSLKL